MPVMVFVVAQLLLGCGGSPLLTLGTTYVDDHVRPESSSMYIGECSQCNGRSLHIKIRKATVSLTTDRVGNPIYSVSISIYQMETLFLIPN